MNEGDRRAKNDADVVIPQKEYVRLYNRQYAELTTLKKSVNPEEKYHLPRGHIKKHYPNVYKDKIKNDYILTSSDRIQNTLNEAPGGAQECQCKDIQMSKQLARS